MKCRAADFRQLCPPGIGGLLSGGVPVRRYMDRLENFFRDLRRRKNVFVVEFFSYKIDLDCAVQQQSNGTREKIRRGIGGIFGSRQNRGFLPNFGCRRRPAQNFAIDRKWADRRISIWELHRNVRERKVSLGFQFQVIWIRWRN